MMTEGNILHTFFQWWWQGLCSIRTSGKSRVRLLEVTDSGLQLIDPSDTRQQLTDSAGELSTIDATSNYLLAPAEQVLNTRIPASLRTEAMPDIAERLLPFKSDELYITTDAERYELFAISKADIAHLLGKPGDHGLTLHGVAFAANDKLHYSPFLSAENPLKLSKPFLRRAALLTGLLVVSGIALWQVESHQQSKLRKQLEDLSSQPGVESASLRQTALTDEDIIELTNALQADAIRPAPQITALLQSVVRSMPENAEFDQLILTEAEFLIDGKASSATQVQTMLEQTEQFSGSEFVTSISTSADQLSERFRLRLVIPGTLEN